MRTIVSLSLFLVLLIACKHGEKAVREDPWADYRKGYALLNAHKDSAYFYFNQAASRSPDKQVVALAYYNMAMIQTDGGDYYGAQESLTLSLRSLDEHQDKDRNYLATDYNELGMTSTRLNNYEQALHFYDLALRYARDSTFKPYIFNNRGNAYRKLQDYANAIASYKEVIRLSRNQNITYARALTNLATAQWLRDPHYDPIPQFMKGLAIRKSQHDTWGENSSYAQLSDYYMKSRPDSARWYAEQMLAVARRLQSPDDEMEALQKLIVLSPAREIKTYFARYRYLTDSLVTKRNAAKNQFALIRYNVEKSKADNLRLQKENTERNYQLGGLLLVIIAGSISGLLWYRKRKQRQELETQNAVRENQRKTSKKVHDTLANDIYRIMKKIQHDRTLDREWLLYNIDDVYQRSRDISYEITTDADEQFQEKISELLTSFATETTKVVLVGNSEELWKKVDASYKFEIKYILQELMVNMKKHSQATNVVIKFEEKADHCLITYFDDGIGIPEGTPPKNGLTNTGNRIKAIHGEITFDAGTGKGLQIQISFPTA